MKRQRSSDHLGKGSSQSPRKDGDYNESDGARKRFVLSASSDRYDRERNQSRDSPSNARIVHSLTNTFQSDSDDFNALISFSGSQSFFHAPNRSLTQYSWDNIEKADRYRPIFNGVDWQALSQNRCAPSEFPMMILVDGDGSTHRQKGSRYQSREFQGNSSDQASQGQHISSLEGGSKVPSGRERHLNSHNQSIYMDDVRSPSHGGGCCREIMSTHSFDRGQRENIDSLYKGNSQREQKQPLEGRIDFVEKILARIISEPVHVMTRKFHEMTAPATSSLKESILEMMLDADKRRDVSTFQMLLQNRSDINLEMLVKCQRAQLETLVALKTGLPDFLQLNNNISSSDLAEIYLNLRCRNPNCRTLLPPYGCDCKICAQKNGFCNACMCFVCSKFDMASKTCSWVGCDVCLHWCHVNCALQASYIRNGPSATGPPGSTEIQFHCAACDRTCEMFGFVKEVFQNFAKEWTLESFRRELEYVNRIFSASKDARGIKLHKVAEQTLAVLANKSRLDVYSHIMSSFADGEPTKMGEKFIRSGNELGESSGGTSGQNQEPPLVQSGYNGKVLQLEKKTNTCQDSIYDRRDKHHLESELQRSAQKEPLFDGLESIVRIKEAEAKMFQAQGDDARSETEGLKRIADVKNEKIEEYTSRIAKLQLAEADKCVKRSLKNSRLSKEHTDTTLV